MKETVKKLLSILFVRHTNVYLNKIIQEFNLKYSIKSLREVLRLYHIDTLAVKISVNDLSNATFPCIAVLKESLVILAEVSNGSVSYINPKNNKTQKETFDIFAEKWTNELVLIEKNENSAEPNYKENKKQEIIENLRMPLLLLVLGLVIGYQAMQFTNMISFAWLGTKLVGTILSVLLLLQSLNKNSLVAKLCSFNKKTDCNSLLTSPAATLFGVVSWAEIGFFYFTSGLLVILLSPQGLEALAGMKLLAFAALPFVAWSVWYQWKIAKVWCPLCLGVAAVLAIETSLSLFTFENETIAIIISQGFIFFSFFMTFFMVLVIYFFLKPFFLSATKVPKLQKELAIFKNNFDIFNSLLHQQKQINEETLPQQIILGNAAAPLTLVFVTNPDCPPCKAAKPKVEALLAQFSEELKVVMVYTKFSEKTPQGLVAAPLEALAELDKEKHKTWCNENQISFTPTFFIAGYQLPELYKVEDLQYFIAEIAE